MKEGEAMEEKKKSHSKKVTMSASEGVWDDKNITSKTGKQENWNQTWKANEI